MFVILPLYSLWFWDVSPPNRLSRMVQIYYLDLAKHKIAKTSLESVCSNGSRYWFPSLVLMFFKRLSCTSSLIKGLSYSFCSLNNWVTMWIRWGECSSLSNCDQCLDSKVNTARVRFWDFSVKTECSRLISRLLFFAPFLQTRILLMGITGK